MNVSTPATTSAGHAAHDLLAIAALSVHDPDLSAAETAAVQALLATCLECARLHADLLALALALPTASTPTRSRDFTLTAADAERLRPRGLRRWLGLIGTSRDTITRPLAIGFTTLGLAGLLVATVPGALPGAGPTARLSAVGNAVSVPEGASAAPAASGAPAAAGAAAPSSESIQASAPPVPADDGNLFSGSDSGDLKSQGANRDLAGDASSDELAVREGASSGLPTLVLLGGLMTIVGLGMFALRWKARHLE